MEEEAPRPSHCWISRVLYLNGQESSTSKQMIHFEDKDDDSMASIFMEVLVEFGKELSIFEDFSPVKMDTGRYILQSDAGFSIIEIDPGWTEEQINQMDEAAAAKVDMKVWGDLFTEIPNERNQ